MALIDSTEFRDYLSLRKHPSTLFADTVCKKDDAVLKIRQENQNASFQSFTLPSLYQKSFQYRPAEAWSNLIHIFVNE